ncbi:MAG: peptide chain release factor N(5)-glutamine methyltransferase [Methylophaga sp.]|nr:peptide chain release factor N(5)-glutamine methyltransferase [Methylophaga sp.]
MAKTAGITLSLALQQAIVVLGNNSVARQDAEILLCHVLNCAPVKLITASAQTLTIDQQNDYQQLLDARLAGQPVAHLIGRRGFWDLDLIVTSDTLIPRPDTECLVAQALTKMPMQARCADLGTGSGAIALALAKQRTDSFWLASDFSQQALTIAKANAANYQLANVQFAGGHWATMIAANSLDLLVSNPPYIADDDPHLKEGDLRFEPRSALAAGPDGLRDIGQIVSQARTVLKEGGWLMIEHGWQQSTAVQDLFKAAGFIAITAHQDFGGQDRVVIGQKPESGKITA